MTSSIPQLQDGEQTVYFQAGGEWCFLKTPKSYSTSNGAVPCVIQCHGHHGYVKDGEADWLTEDFKLSFVNSLIDTGIAVASTNATGNHWGDPTPWPPTLPFLTPFSKGQTWIAIEWACGVVVWVALCFGTPSRDHCWDD